jgi:tetratricopeptide (TPR) repeat protein
MSLGWLAAAGVLLLIAGLGTLAYDGLRRRQGSSPYPYPDDATNRLEGTAIQPVIPRRKPRLPVISLPPSLNGLVRLTHRALPLAPAARTTAARQRTFFRRFLLSIPRRSIVIIVLGSLALIAVSLSLLAEGPRSPQVSAGSVIMLIGPLGNNAADIQEESQLAGYIAQSAAAGGIVPVTVRTVGLSQLDPAGARAAIQTAHADFAIWGQGGADGTFTANIALSPDFAAGRMPWQELNDPDIIALALPTAASIIFRPGAATDPLVPLSLALSYFRLGKYRAAADAAWGAQETLNQAGDTGEFARLLEAEARLAQGKYGDSITDLAEVERAAPSWDEALIARALDELYLNEHDNAISDCARVIDDRNAADDILAKAYLIRAQARSTGGDLSGALSDLEESGRLNPTSLRVLLVRAEIYYRQALPNQAATELGELIAAQPGAAPAYRLMGLVRLMMGQPQDSLGALDSGYALYSGWIAQLREEEAQANAIGATSNAQEATEGIIALNNKLAEIALYQGMAWADIARSEPKESFLAGIWRGIRGEPTDWQRALTKMQEAQRLEPHRPDVPLQIGSLYKEQGDYADATRLLTQARDLDPSAPEPYMALAQVQAAQNQPKDAIATLVSLLARSPGYYPAYDQLHTLYVGVGDSASAQATLEQAVAVTAQSASDHLWHGEFLSTLGRMDEAEGELRLAAQDPQLWNAHLLLGQLLLKSNRGPEALTEFRAVLASQPNNETALLEAGKLMVLAGKQDDAQTLFTRLTAVAPANVDGHLALLQLLLAKQDPGDAITEGNRAVAIDDSRSDSHYFLGLAFESAGDWHDASSQYATATQRDPKNFQAFLSLEKSHFMEDRYGESISAAAGAAALRPDSAEAYRWKAESELSLGETDQALSTLTTLLGFAPGDADALALTSRVYAARNDQESATTFAQRAIDAGPNNPAGQLALGDIDLQQGKSQDALQAFEAIKTMGDAHNRSQAISGEGRAYYSLGDSQKALQLYNSAAQLDPHAGEPYLYMGGLYSAVGRWDEAFQAYHRAVELRPNWPLALYYLGESYLQRKDLQNAQAAFAKATTFSPNMVDAWFGLGMAERGQGHSKDAIDALSKATRLNGNYAEAWLYLGLSYEENGQPAEAASALLQAKNNSNDPNIITQAEQGLARVR